MCWEIGSDFLTAVTAFVNLVLAGGCPVDMAPFFFGRRLISLKKNSGGLCPIAIGFTLRRLASKCANTSLATNLATYFSPIQLGTGIPGGCEAAVHAARRFLQGVSVAASPVLATIGMSVCLSVCPSVCLSHAGTE